LVADGLLIATALLAIFNNNRAVQLGAPAFHLVARAFGFVLSSHPRIARADFAWRAGVVEAKRPEI
jgi:hypothetical protein